MNKGRKKGETGGIKRRRGKNGKEGNKRGKEGCNEEIILKYFF